MADQVQRIRLEIDGEQVANSYNDLTLTQRKLKRELRGVEEGTEEWIKKSQQLNRVNKRLDEVKGKINATGKEWKKQTAAYKKGISDRISGTRLYGTSLGDLGNGFKLVTSGIASATTASKLFKVALASTGIGLIILALGSLVTWLTTTQSGMDKVSAVTRPLSAIFQRLLGVIQDLGGRVFKQLTKAIDNPRQAFKDLGQIIMDNVINRFKSLGVFADAFADLMSGKVKVAMQGFSNGAIQLTTGITDASGKLSQAGDAVKNFVADSVEAGTRIDRLRKEIEILTNSQIVNSARLRSEFEKEKEIAQDRSRSEEERIEAAQKAVKIQDELLFKEQKLLDKKIQLKEIEHSLNDTTRADEKELANLRAESIRLEGQAAKKRTSARTIEQTVLRELATEEKNRIKEMSEASKNAYDKQRVALMQKRANDLLTEQQYKVAIEELELAHLTTMLEMKRSLGEDTLAIEEEIAAREISAMQAAHDAKSKLDQEAQLNASEVAKAREEQARAEIEASVQSGFAAVQGAKSVEEAGKAVLNSITNQIKARIASAVSAVVEKALISTPWPFNIAIAATAGASAQLLMDQVIPSFYFGTANTGFGDAGLGKDQYGYIRGLVHENETVIPASLQSDPYVVDLKKYIASGAIGTPPNPTNGNNVGNSNDANRELSQAAIKLGDALRVLQENGIPSYFGNDEFDRARKFNREIQTLKSKTL